MAEGTTHRVSRVINADPATLYGLVSDVTRHGEWSPECRGARWIDGATGPEPGARFLGRNRWGLLAWSRTCEVEEAVPGERFAFRTVPGRLAADSTRWAYTFEEVPGGTRVTESYEIVVPVPVRVQTSVIRALLPHHFDMRPHMAATLAAVEAGTGLLPGQAAAPPGPLDVTGMWVMHHAFRRDLARFAAAVAGTPLADRPTWRALRDRWDRFAVVLHKHHTGEDDGLWPLLRERAAAAGDHGAVATLDAMEAEHAVIDPLLASCRAGFEGLAAGATEAGRAEQSARVAATVEALQAHLGHEERDAMALVQAHLSAGDWERLEKEVFQAAYRPRDLAFAVSWAFDGLPAATRRRMLADGGPVLRLLSRVLAPAFRRGERRAFGAAYNLVPASGARMFSAAG
ncbi:hemerythrin domain-containing protein [Actinoplanes sp. NPDC024001]|uniref:hemerythrin domain-containing protein n=1 Tax=Actinoplanes sp. NPDC024001 TaxID=3154598 RepID=UPI0033F5CB34